ncbi:MAG: hypothetical protein GKR94_23085 [Gammaproteobacteria bacterium]|nr:hypothetical protein [Gammaproteobacteria bacterium]
MLPAKMPARGLVAHRGLAASYPENCARALLAAVESGINIVEFDLQCTADGVPVLLHDESLQRTAGDERLITAVDSGALDTVDVGYAERFGAAFAGMPLERLADMVEALADRPEVVSLVELKSQSVRYLGAEVFAASVDRLLQPLAGRAIVISFCSDVLGAARKAGWPIGYCLTAFDAEARARCERLEPQLVLFDERDFKAGASLWSGPWRYGCWEITEPERALELLDAGVDYIESMAPEVLARDAGVVHRLMCQRLRCQRLR